MDCHQNMDHAMLTSKVGTITQRRRNVKNSYMVAARGMLINLKRLKAVKAFVMVTQVNYRLCT